MCLSRTNAHRGFTLVEVLIALTLSVMLIAILFNSLHTYIRSSSATRDNLTLSRQANSVMQFLSRQIREIAPLTTHKGRQIEALFYGDKYRITYIGRVPRHRSAGGLHRNSLMVDGNRGRRRLTFNFERFLNAEGFDESKRIDGEEEKSKTLISNLMDVSFEYFGLVDGEVPARWTERWQAQSQLPEMIKIHLSEHHARRPKTLIVPIHANRPSRHLARNTMLKGSELWRGRDQQNSQAGDADLSIRRAK